MTLKITPTTSVGLSRAGFSSLTDAQTKALSAWESRRDILLQSRAGTGKSSLVGIAEAQCLHRVGVSLFMTVNKHLVDQQQRFLEQLLKDSNIQIIRILDDGKIHANLCGKRSIVLGTADSISSIPNLPQSVPVLRLYVDEADEMVSDGRKHLSFACVNRFVAASTKLMFMTSTMPPFIAVRIRELLESLAPKREEDELTHIELCTSTSTDCTVNAVRANLAYSYIIRRNNQHLGYVIMHLLREHESKHSLSSRTIVFGASLKECRSVTKYFGVARSNMKISVDAEAVTSSTWDMLFDTKGVYSRGLNFTDLDIVICVGVPEDKETLLHQWGRAARTGNRSGAVYIIIDERDVEQLEYLSFQLGVVFTPCPEIPDSDRLMSVAPLHPFHSQTDTCMRLQEIQKLVCSQFHIH